MERQQTRLLVRGVGVCAKIAPEEAMSIQTREVAKVRDLLGRINITKNPTSAT